MTPSSTFFLHQILCRLFVVLIDIVEIGCFLFEAYGLSLNRNWVVVENWLVPVQEYCVLS